MKPVKVSRRRAREAALQALFCNAFSKEEMMRSVTAVQHVKTIEDLRDTMASIDVMEKALGAARRAAEKSIQSMHAILKEGGKQDLKASKDPIVAAATYVSESRQAAMSTMRETVQKLTSVDPLFDGKSFTMRLLKGVEINDDAIDAAIKRALVGWNVRRLTAEDHALLRLGALELMYFHDVPPAAIIDQYIELSKEYSDDEGPKLINGVLDRIHREYPREAKEKE